MVCSQHLADHLPLAEVCCIRLASHTATPTGWKTLFAIEWTHELYGSGLGIAAPDDCSVAFQNKICGKTVYEEEERRRCSYCMRKYNNSYCSHTLTPFASKILTEKHTLTF